jgi:hypothetical protein
MTYKTMMNENTELERIAEISGLGDTAATI